MGMISGLLQSMSAVQREGANGPWTKYLVKIDGREYQVQKDVFNTAGGFEGQYVNAEVTSREKENGYTDWYAKAIFKQADGQTAVTVPRAGVLTEVGKNASICRQVAAKILVEAGVAPGSQVFWLEIGPIAKYFATGEKPEGVESPTEPPEPKPGYEEQEQRFIPEGAKLDPYDEAIKDDDIPF